MRDYIAQREHLMRGTLFYIVARLWAARGYGRPPAQAEARGSVAARVNHGRWIVDCPNRCGNALAGSVAEPYYLCPDCGSPENGGQWYGVAFPVQREAIEAQLLKRPALSPAQTATRNWELGETVAMLRKENKARGIT